MVVVVIIAVVMSGAVAVRAPPWPPSSYTVTVINRSLTGAPLLQYPSTSFSPEILNPAWLPLPNNNTGGGLFFRTIAAPGTSVYNAIGFVKAFDSEGLLYPKATLGDLLHDGPNRTLQTDGADPRAIHRPATGEYLLIYQGGGYSGRHSVLSRTRTPLDITSWKRDPAPLFANMTKADGKTPLQIVSTVLADCSGASQYRWTNKAAEKGRLLRDVTSPASQDALCLTQMDTEWDSDLYVGLAPCNDTTVTLWYFDPDTKQLKAAAEDACLDVSGGKGPVVSWYPCHNRTHRDIGNQQFALDKVTSNGGTFQLRSLSAEGKQCVSMEASIPNDSGSSLWFPNDAPDGTTTGKAYAVATFGELRGGNLSLVSTDDLVHWRFEKVILKSRPGYWDDGALSIGPSPQRLSDGNWLFLYDIDRLYPVRNPKPLPAFGRCALGWAIVDQHNFSNILARAEEPLVYAQLPWELKGFTEKVVYVTGVKAEKEENVYTIYAGAGDKVVEAFRIHVSIQKLN